MIYTCNGVAAESQVCIKIKNERFPINKLQLWSSSFLGCHRLLILFCGAWWLFFNSSKNSTEKWTLKNKLIDKKNIYETFQIYEKSGRFPNLLIMNSILCYCCRKYISAKEFLLTSKKHSLKIYAAVAMLNLGFSKGSKMDSEVLIKPLQNIVCLPQIPA